MDDKELALAVNFAKAPKEIQAAATDLAAMNKKIAKAQQAITQGTSDLSSLQTQQRDLARKFKEVLAGWDPNADVAVAAVK